MPESDLRKVLDDAGIGYELLRHEHTESALAEAQALGIPLDNVEGMTLGPLLPDGRRALVLVSDNNFASSQFTQLLLFALG